MTELQTTIAQLRDGVVAILRIHPATAEQPSDGRHIEVKCSFGTGFCIAENQYVLTANHVLTQGGPRDERDRFFALAVPGNGDRAHHFPVTTIVAENPELDFAVLEIGECVTPGVRLPSLPLSFDAVNDGARVATVGYPSPEIGQINIDDQLVFHGGQLFLKSHANEGIVAAQYEFGRGRMYELNVGWHHGESGGPIATIGAEPKVFSVMQHYRNVQTPHGTVAGPHRGFAIATIERELRALGVVP